MVACWVVAIKKLQTYITSISYVIELEMRRPARDSYLVLKTSNLVYYRQWYRFHILPKV